MQRPSLATTIVIFSICIHPDAGSRDGAEFYQWPYHSFSLGEKEMESERKSKNQLCLKEPGRVCISEITYSSGARTLEFS